MMKAQKPRRSTNMKTVTTRKSHTRRQYGIPYPNAATKQQLFDQFVELLLTAAVGIGGAAILLFIMAIS
jgi:hypothetical protein